MNKSTKNIYLFITDSGGGHRSIANSLLEGIQEKGHDWDIHIINAYNIASDTLGDSIYNVFQKNVFLKLLWWPLMIPLLFFINMIFNIDKNGALKMNEFLLSLPPEKAPDLIISNSPYLHSWIRDGIENDFSHIPFLIYIPDFAETPHKKMCFIIPFKEDDRIKFHYICPTPKAANQVREAGYPEKYITEIPGVIINSRFYTNILPGSDEPEKIKEYRTREGLQPELLTGFVMFGGSGSSEMLTIAKNLLKKKDTQLIFICGNNEKLKIKLDKLKEKNNMPWLIKGFSKEIPYLMSISDFFIGKPGPGSLSEAVHMNLPVITIDNFTVMLQEKANPQWIIDNKLGIILKSFSQIEKGISQISDRAVFEEFRENCKKIDNNGLYAFIEVMKTSLEDTVS